MSASADSTHNDLSLLKSLLGTRSSSDLDRKATEVDVKMSGKKSLKISEEQDGDTHKVTISMSNRPRSPDTKKRQRKRRPRTPRAPPLASSVDLESKYRELQLLMSDEFTYQQEMAKLRLIQETKRLFLMKYGLGHQKHPVALSPHEVFVQKADAADDKDEGTLVDKDGNQIILIDATQGKNGVTKRVTFKQTPVPPSGEKARPLSAYMAPRRSFNRHRPQSAPSPARKSSPQKKSAEDGRRKSRSRERNCSSSSEYETDSESPSRKSRSRSRDKFDHYLKNTDIPQIQEWLKNKNKQHRQQKKQKRREVREKRMQEQEDIRKKAEKSEISKEKVKEWMSLKNKELRLLRKRERQSRKSCNDEEENEASELMKENDENKNGNNCNCSSVQKKPPASRFQSVPYSKPIRPQSSRDPAKPKKEVEERDERRISYEDWLKKVRVADAMKKKEQKEREAALRESVDGADKELISSTAKRRLDSMRKQKKAIDTGLAEVDDEANSYPEEQEVAGPRYQLEGERRRPKSAQPKKKKTALQAQRPASAVEGPQKSQRKFRMANQNGMSRSADRKSPAPPKPGKHVTGVKYQQQSWDEFSDYVWEKLNEEEEHHEYEEEMEDADSSYEEAASNHSSEESIQSSEKQKSPEPEIVLTITNTQPKQDTDTAEVVKSPDDKKHVHFAEMALEIHESEETNDQDDQKNISNGEQLDDQPNPTFSREGAFITENEVARHIAASSHLA